MTDRDEPAPADPLREEKPHDILAAEEFGIGTREERLPADPSGIREPHDILAAEEFGIGTRDEHLPGDPTGLREPHDILAAEEFPMPAGAEPHADSGPSPASRLVPAFLAGLVLAVLVARRRR